MATLYSNQASNVRKTWLMVSVFLVLVIALGFVLSVLNGNPAILYASVGISLLMNIGAYWFSDKLVLSMANARPIEKKEDYPELWNTLENLCTFL
jgi:heat shock protein HtpX